METQYLKNGDEKDNHSDAFFSDIKKIKIKRINFTYKFLFSFIITILLILLILNNVCAQNSCGNSGFESDDFTGWIGQTGISPMGPVNNPVMTNTGIVNGRHTITSGGNDWVLSLAGITLPKVAPNGGLHSVKLGNESVGSEAERLSYRFLVTPDNASFVYQYAVVLNDPGHDGRPMFTISIKTTLGESVPCGDYNVQANAGIPGFSYVNIANYPTGPASIIYKQWTSVPVNLYDYIGDSVVVEFTTADCTAGEHFGYAYIDAYCNQMEIETSYCAGDPTAQLTAPSGYQFYQWINGQLGQTITLNNPQNFDSLTVFMTPAEGCEQILTVYIDSIPVPVASFNHTEACVDEIIHFTDSSYIIGIGNIVTHHWIFENGDTSAIANPDYSFSSLGDHLVTLIVTSDRGCIDTIIQTINISACPCFTPPFTIDIIQPPCHNSNALVQFQGSATISAQFIWNFGQGTVLNGSGAGPFELSFPHDSLAYVVALSVTDYDTLGNACAPDSSFNTVLFPAPISTSISVDNVSCHGGQDGSATIIASGGTPPFTYQWSDAQQQQTTTADSLFQGMYYVSVYDFNNCIKTDSAIISQPSAFSAVLNPTDLLCFGNNSGSVSVFMNGGTPPFSFAWSNGQTVQNPTGLAAGIHVVNIEDDENCIYTYSATINQPTQLAGQISFIEPKCYGGSDGEAFVSASGGTPPYTYFWNTFSESEHITGLWSSLYSMTITDANNCRQYLSSSMNEPEPVIVTLPSSFTACKNLVTTITATSIGGTPPYLFHWNNGATGQQIVLTPSSVHNFNVYVTDANNCISNSAYTTVNVYPDIDISLIQRLDSICPGDTVSIFPQIQGGKEPFTVLLNNGGVPSPFIIIPEFTQTFTVSVRDDCGLTDQDSIHIVVMPLPEINIEADIYKGCQPLTVHFHETTPFTGETYIWHFDDWDENNLSLAQNPIHVFDEFGIYTISLLVTSKFGCRAKLIIPNMIEVYPKPEARFTTDKNHVSINSPLVSYFDNSVGAAQYCWSFGDGDSSLTQNPMHSFYDYGEFTTTLIVTSDKQCKDTAEVLIIVEEDFTFYAPSAFSPDNDGRNDMFNVFGTGINEDDFSLMIYDRWGELIFTSDKLEYGWDGKIKGEKVATIGTYVWMATYRDRNKNQHQKSGYVTVIR